MIKILDLRKFSNKLKPVTSPDIFAGSSSSGDFNPEGIYSEIIFGPLESKQRMTTYSYIDLNAKVIHPIILNILTRLDRKILGYISTLNYFEINEAGELIEVENGLTGLSNFIKYFDKIKFRGGTPDRDRLIQLINKTRSEKKIFIDKIPVIPPFYREIYQDQNKQWIIDELNEIYCSLIRKSLSVKSQNENSGVLGDLLFYGIQKAVNVHHEYIKKKIEKKSGIIRNKLMGKRVDFSAYGVIVTEPSLKPNEIGVPLRAAVSLFEPFILFLLLRSGRYKNAYLEEIFNEYKEGMEISVENIKSILKAIKNDDDVPKRLHDLIKEVCEIIAQKRYVIAKRDPVLLPESYQGYKPVIFDGDTIRIAPVHVGGHNADFDGDSVICDVVLENENGDKIHSKISDLEKSKYFKHDLNKEKPDVSHYDATEPLYIKAINTENGDIKKKKITDYSVHRNIKMYKIKDTKNRFKEFWSSEDHSLIIYNSELDIYQKVSPKDLIENPLHKFFVQITKI
jgi:DNA-directed RNA polymerase beta' subunit